MIKSPLPSAMRSSGYTNAIKAREWRCEYENRNKKARNGSVYI